jgi:hypothetical protein
MGDTVVPPAESNETVYLLIFHCALYVVFSAGIVDGTLGDQPVNVYPVRVTLGAESAVP